MREAAKEVTWRDLFGNPYLHKLHPDMATDEGYKTLVTVRLKGMSHIDPKQLCLVHFDREYLMQWLVKNYFKPLKFANWNDAQKVVSEGFKIYKAELSSLGSASISET